MSPSGQSLYQVLGVEPGASAAEIRSAYRRAARESHPDRGGSSERFHLISQAYTVLSDPQQKASYDRQLGRNGTSGSTASSPGGRPVSGPAASASSAGPADLAQAPVFVPDFSPEQPPVLPLALAGRQVHGEPRPPGFFRRLGSGAADRLRAEHLTIGLLSRELLDAYPAARLVSGLEIPGAAPRTGTLEISHVLLGGYRMAVLQPVLASPGNYRWDGQRLLHRNRAVSTAALDDAVRTLQGRFPECTVSGWLVLHSPGGNPFEPVVDYPPSASRSAPAARHAANAGGLIRYLRTFFAEGPRPQTVQLPVLAALISAADR